MEETGKIIDTAYAGSYTVYVDELHKFGTDAFLLADFASPHRKDIVCDLCTGSGIIPFLMCRNQLPKRIYAVDIQKEAIALVQKSIAANALTSTIIPICEDLKSLSLEVGSCDMVTANPPYYTVDSGNIRAGEGIARHELFCNIDDVVKAAAKLLKFGGTLKLCHIPERLVDVLTAMRYYHIEPKVLTFVTSTSDIPWLFLISGKKGGKKGIVVSSKQVGNGNIG